MKGITVTFMGHNILALWNDPGIYQVFCFPLFLLYDLLE